MPAITTFAELRNYPHPYLAVLAEEEWSWGWRVGSSVAAIFAGDHRPFLLILGADADEVDALIEQGVTYAPDSRIAVERGHADLIERHGFTERRSDWDWMGIFAHQTWPLAKQPVVDLGLDHDAEIRAFLDTASPTASTQPGSEEIITWHGIRSEGGLIAVGAAVRWKSGAIVLASIATDPLHRGRGLATDVTASLTRTFFERGEQRVTLGMYAHNEAARRAYQKVGYQLLGEFTSASPQEI